MAGKSYFFSKPTNRFFSLEKENPAISEAPAFEFDESEIWDSQQLSQSESRPESKKTIPSSRNSKKLAKKANGSSATGSMPVNIPDWSKISNRRREVEEESSDEEGEVRVPPHELLAKQLARTRIASFSLHEGVGRTLKGRDLSRVRNAIWEKTGFQD